MSKTIINCKCGNQIKMTFRKNKVVCPICQREYIRVYLGKGKYEYYLKSIR